jgi:hypothetical protein
MKKLVMVMKLHKNDAHYHDREKIIGEVGMFGDIGESEKGYRMGYFVAQYRKISDNTLCEGFWHSFYAVQVEELVKVKKTKKCQIYP